MQRETIEIPCDDGTRLAGELLIPAEKNGVVQINAGTAAKRGVYRKLAEYLCEHGFVCCLWDYRGSGKSRRGSLKNSTITYSDYGTKDLPAVKRYLETHYPDLPLCVVAHSAGGQQIGFMPNWRGIGGVINLGVSAAYFKNMPRAYRLRAYFFFYGVVPISDRLCGYVAASSLKLMEDLPTPVAREWCDWLEVTDYFFDDAFYGNTVPIGAFRDFDFPIHNVYASDDSISTTKNMENFWKHVESTEPITFERITPGEFGLDRIDHFGYFKGAMRDGLWADIARRLEGWVAG